MIKRARTSFDIMKIVTCIAFAFAMSFSLPAKSKDKLCDIDGIENMPRVTTSKDGVPLSKPVRYKVFGELYDVPIGYNGGSSSYIKLEKGMKKGLEGEVIETTRGFGFSFWMPSLRYPERTKKPTFFKSCEQGRPKPVSGQSVVLASFDKPKTENGITRTPRKIFEIAKARNKVATEEAFGLLRFRFGDGPWLGETYISKQNAEYEVRLKCLDVKFKVPNPGCNGVIYDGVTGYLYKVRFSRDEIANWSLVIDGIKKLLASWKV